MKLVALSQGKFAKVDDEDFDRVSAMGNWYPKADAWSVYARVRRGNGGWVTMHRFVMNVSDPKVIIDHKNFDGLDNRKSNLRICTNMQNCQNQRKAKNNSSGYKGVSFMIRYKSKPWSSSIRHGGKKVHLGFFTTREQAARVYDANALKFFGEFAHLNFPQ